MGIDIWIPKGQLQAEQTAQDQRVNEIEPTQPAPSVPEVESEPATVMQADIPVANDELTELGWTGLQEKVRGCRRCDLHQSRTQTVFGVGNPAADLLIIGEAPGADEDKQGEPFVGQAGQLLNAMLQAIQLSRAEVYIANILKCRPPENHDPSAEEARLCSAYLNRQIELIQPKVILALGRVAAHRLLHTDTKLGELRGLMHEFPLTKTPLIVTYHPAYLLRSPTEKRKSWQDLLFVKRTLGGYA